jgi:tRNA_anti-like
MKRKWLILLIILLLLPFVGYKYIYQDHRDIQKESAEFVLFSIKIVNEFSQNSTKAEKKYLNKTIEISGVITEVNKKDLTINNKIFCLFNNTINSAIKINQNIKIKGRCIGYDNLLELVKIDQSTIIK